MLFTSYQFLLYFLPVTFIGFFFLGGRSIRLAAAWLALASLFFYAYWNYKFVALLLASIAVNYIVGLCIGRNRAKPGWARRFMVLGVAFDLALLGFFKYANFFISTADYVGGLNIALADIVLPLGISFFTFTQIAFIVDVYRGEAKEYNFVHYLLFVTYFPHLIAGPILHHKQIMPQFDDRSNYRINFDSIAMGLCIFIIGFAKKLILADGFGAYATPVFDAARDGAHVPMGVAWVGALAYTLQLYFDFSGYSDMAIGLSKLFGVNLPLNFNSPYKSSNIIEFWRRWHMTLSQFLRDYLYIPLGGNRHGGFRRYINLLLTMLIGGLWHGANWTFVAWGVVHGVALVINHGWQAGRRRLFPAAGPGGRFSRTLAIAGTFLVIVFAWVLFRAETFAAAIAVFKGMSGASDISLPAKFSSLAAYLPTGVRYDGLLWSQSGILNIAGSSVLPKLALGLFIVFGLPNSQQIVAFIHDRYSISRKIGWATCIGLGSLFALSVLATRQVSEFLYFQF